MGSFTQVESLGLTITHLIDFRRAYLSVCLYARRQRPLAGSKATPLVIVCHTLWAAIPSCRTDR